MNYIYKQKLFFLLILLDISFNSCTKTNDKRMLNDESNPNSNLHKINIIYHDNLSKKYSNLSDNVICHKKDPVYILQNQQLQILPKNKDDCVNTFMDDLKKCIVDLLKSVKMCSKNLCCCQNYYKAHKVFIKEFNDQSISLGKEGTKISNSLLEIENQVFESAPIQMVDIEKDLMFKVNNILLGYVLESGISALILKMVGRKNMFIIKLFKSDFGNFLMSVNSKNIRENIEKKTMQMFGRIITERTDDKEAEKIAKRFYIYSGSWKDRHDKYGSMTDVDWYAYYCLFRNCRSFFTNNITGKILLNIKDENNECINEILKEKNYYLT